MTQSDQDLNVSRLTFPLYAEALGILGSHGASAGLIDLALDQGCGLSKQPLKYLQEAGLKSVQQRFEQIWLERRFCIRFEHPRLLDNPEEYQTLMEQVAPEPWQPGPRPSHVIVEGDLGIADPLIDLAEKAKLSITVDEDDTVNPGLITVGHTHIMLTPGALATEIHADLSFEEGEGLVLLDICRDFATCPFVILAPSDQSDDEHVSEAAGFFQALGKTVYVMDDSPAMIVARVLAQMCEHALEPVQFGKAKAPIVDAAIKSSLNADIGPLALADIVSPGYLQTVLENLGRIYGLKTYRAGVLLRRRVASGQPVSV